MGRRTISRPACLLLLVLLAASAFAARQQPETSLTVDQLDRLLAGARDTSDRSLARQLAGLQLSERASSSKLRQWQEQFTGTRTREALLALADASAFLPLPPSQVLAHPAPNEQTLTQLRQRMVDYVKTELPRLPNFVAQRTTTAFAISTGKQLLPQQTVWEMLEPAHGKPPSYRGYHALGAATASRLPDGQLFWVGSFAQTVTFRDGAEVPDSSATSLIATSHLAVGLTTEGEFGAILRVLLLDAEPEQIVWAFWERSPIGDLAVFHYSVPRARSHFAASFNPAEQPDYPAYHGEIAIAPETGEVYRITISTYAHDPDFAYAGNLMVEFGPTQIGNVTYICPTRGVAISRVFSPYADADAVPPPISSQTSINDVTFTNYHVFRANARVITAKPQE